VLTRFHDLRLFTPPGVFATTSRIRASSSSTRGASTFKRYTIAARAS